MKAEPPVRLLSVKRGCRPKYSASDRPAKKSSGRQMNRPSTSPSRKPASAIASMDALAASSSEVWPVASPTPSVARPVIAVYPRGKGPHIKDSSKRTEPVNRRLDSLPPARLPQSRKDPVMERVDEALQNPGGPR